MPRIVRDSDDDVETKTTTRRTTRAAAAASVTDSPARRTTRNKKPVIDVDSSSEVEEVVQPKGRSTRSRAATLDKQTAVTTVRNLRSRQISGSSDLSESLDAEADSLPKRVTRKQAAGASASNTPTIVNAKTRSIRASSEAKSTPPVTSTKNKRLTRASSVDLNESTGTPVKRRTRASMAPMEPSVTEEQEIKTDDLKSLENSVMEVDEEDYESTENLKKDKSKIKSHIDEDEEKDSSNVKEPLNDSGKSSLDSYSLSAKHEEGMINKSSVSNDTHEESTLHSIDTGLESALSTLASNLTNKETKNIESSILSNKDTLTEVHDISVESKVELDCSKNQSEIVKIISNDGNESETIDVEELTESAVSDETLSEADSPEKSKTNIETNYLNVEIKDSYVKLDRTNIVEKILNEKLEVNKIDLITENGIENNESNITSTKTAVILISDFVKNDENNLQELFQKEKITSIDIQQTSNEILKDECNSKVENSTVKFCINDGALNEVPLKYDTDKISDSENECKNTIKNLTSTSEISKMATSNVLDVNQNDDKIDDSIFTLENDNDDLSENKSNFVFINSVTENNDSETHNLDVNTSNDKVNTSVCVNVMNNCSLILVETNTEIIFSSNNIENNNPVKESSHEPVETLNLVNIDVNDNDTENMNSAIERRESEISIVEIDDLPSNNQVEETNSVAYDDPNKSTNSVTRDTIGIEGKELETINENNEQSLESKLTTDQVSEVVNNNLNNSKNEKDTSEQMDVDAVDSEGNDNVDSVIDVLDDTDSDCNDIELKLIEADNNSVSSVVTDAVDENASSPQKMSQELDETSSSPKKSLKKDKKAEKTKSKSKVDDSDDSDCNVNGLFQDILADEWISNQNKSVRAENAEGDGEEDKSSIGEKTPKKDRKSSESKRLSKSNGEADANESLLKKTCKALEKIQSSEDVDSNSGSKNSSLRQDTNSTIVPSDADDAETNENESPNKSRRSLNKSVGLSESKSKRHSKSIHDESDLAVEHKSVAKEQVDEDDESDEESEEKEDAEVEHVHEKSLNKSRKSLGKVADDCDISLNKSRKSVAKVEDNESDEEMEVDEDEQVQEKSPNKSRKSLNASKHNMSVADNEASRQNESSAGQNKSSKSKSDKFSTSLIESNKSKNKEPEKRSSLPASKFFASFSKGLIDEENNTSDEEEEPEKTKSPNKSKRLSNSRSKKSDQVVSNAEADVSLKNKSLKETSLKKSLNKFAMEEEHCSDAEEAVEMKNAKSPETAAKSPKSKKEANEDIESDVEDVESADKLKLDTSLQKSINYSTVAHFDSSEDESDSNKQEKADEEEEDDDDDDDDEEDEEDDEEDEDSDDEMDSDVAKEYNLSGKKVRYEDDDMPGDECKVSEEESSDPDDDGEDLGDFIVSDDGVESDEDEEDEDEAEEVSDDVPKSKKDASANASKLSVKNSSRSLRPEESDSESNEKEEEEASKKVASKNTTLNKSKNDSTVFKNKSINMPELGDSSSSEEEKEEAVFKNKSINLSKSIIESPKLKKNKLMKVSSSVVDNSLNLSKSMNSKSVNLSKSMLDSSKLNKSKNASAHRGDSSSESEQVMEKSTSKKTLPAEIASPSESESENGEDSYRVITVDYQDESTKQVKSKKRNLLIECSTPKPGATKKVGFADTNTTSFLDKDSMSTTVNKSSRRKSGSLNDLTDTKIVSSRMSLGEVASKSVVDDSAKGNVTMGDEAPEALKSRQMWKLIPLSQTLKVPGEETPKTKFLKKSKLNDSVPVLKTGDLSLVEGSKKDKSKRAKNTSLPLSTTLFDVGKDAAPVIIDATESGGSSLTKKSKKRKLQDMSTVPSVDDDDSMIVDPSKKKKKRARIEETLNEFDQNSEPVEEAVETSKKKSRKADKYEEAEEEEEEDVNYENVHELDEEPSEKKKKKKQSKAKEVEVVEEKQKKKKKKAQKEVEEEKPKKEKKKKAKVNFEEVEEPVVKPQKKKSKQQPVEDSDDEAPEVLDFSLARRVAVKAIEEASQAVKALKEAKKKKNREPEEATKKNLKRLPDDFLENLTDEPTSRPQKRQKLTLNTERKVVVKPSKSMFSPGKAVPENLEVDDGNIPLSSGGGTTQFSVVNLNKAKKVAKTNPAVMSFRQKMLARNKREPTAKYLAYLRTTKAKGGA